jgi:Protein of unknown function (DUF2809)
MTTLYKKKVLYFLVFIFLTWLALATRNHKNWFCPLIVQYGGDTIWAAMFLFFLRIFFTKTNIVNLAITNFLLGAADETLQLYQAPWIQAIRHTKIGGLLLGFGFLWSDIICYFIGTLLSLCTILLIEKYALNKI